MQNVAFMVQGLLENHTEGAQSVMDRHSESIHAGRLKRGVATAWAGCVLSPHIAGASYPQGRGAWSSHRRAILSAVSRKTTHNRISYG